MVRRTVTALAGLGVISTVLLAAAPAQAATCSNSGYAAATCPTAGGIAATSWVVVPYLGTSPAVQLQASFNDPGNAIPNWSVTFTVTGPGVSRTVYPGSGPTVNGTVKVYSAAYLPSSSYSPGTYRVTASAGTYGNSAFAVSTSAASFVVKHQTKLTIYPSNYAPKLGSKVRFDGRLAPTAGVAGQKVTFVFKAKGTKGWKKKGSAKVKADGSYRSGKTKLTSYGKWRVKFGGTSYLLPAKAGLIYKKTG